MLRIYPVCLEIVEEVQPYAARIAEFDLAVEVVRHHAAAQVSS